MSTRAPESFWGLTEKEKHTLRLIVRGHDAKSTARSLGLSVHTINERLRDARRKMAVSSSREAARLLLEAEGGPEILDPDFLGDTAIGEDAGRARADPGAAPGNGVGLARRHARILAGALVMIVALGLLALAALPQATPTAPPATEATAKQEVIDAARNWLELLDQGNWDETYRLTAKSFRELNTLQVWIAASQEARAPLGAMLSRTLISQENVPAPPRGYEVVKFRTRFANREAVETVTFDRENGEWRVTGVMID